MDINEFHTFRNKIVRDLAWVIASPPVFNSISDCPVDFIAEKECTNEYLMNRDHLIQLDQNPEPLQQHVHKTSSHLLGKYFESLVHYWLSITPTKELLKTNLQIFDNSRTIGELDFIYRDLDNDEIIHIEAAGKFYLSTDNKPDWEYFIGPNTNDRMDLKLDRMISHQTQLINHEVTLHTIKSNGIPQPDRAKIFYKGYSFFNFHEYVNNTFLLPKESNRNHFAGWWLRDNEISKLRSTDSRWVILERMNWISKCHNPPKNFLLTFNELTFKIDSYFRNNIYPLLIAEVCHNTNTELSRGFIVSDKYPDIEMKK